MTQANERLLIAAAQRDRSRFAELYESYFERVYAYVVRRVGNREEAEDITADVFHQALAHIARFEWRGVPFAAWLYRIAANAIADRSKQAGRERGNPALEKGEETDWEEIERQARLFQLVRGLPADQQRVIEARFVEERSIREVAGELGRSEGAVKQLQLRALENLRARMGTSHG